MNVYEAKKDMRQRLQAVGVTANVKVSGKTVDFTDLARATPVFVTVRGQITPEQWTAVNRDIPRPSLGGYCTVLERT